MRILHVLDHSVPLHSGYSFRTIALLHESRALGYETIQLTSPKQSQSNGILEETVDGWHFFRTPRAGGLVADIPALGELEMMGDLSDRIEGLVRRFSPHVIHAHSPVLNAIPALRVAKRLGIPVVYEIRAFWEDAAVDHGTTHEGSLRYRFTKGLETYAAKRVDHVITICEGLKLELVRRGIAPDRVTVVPNGVDIARFSAVRSPEHALRNSMGLQGSVVLGFVGSFYAYEGLQLLVRALPKVLEALPNVKLLLVGGGFEEDNLKRQVNEMGLQGTVLFPGRVPHQEVPRYYDLIDVLVYPRFSMRLTELVTPLKPLEAMAQGRLVVASDVGGHRELMVDGKTAVLFRAGDTSDLAVKVIGLLQESTRWPALRAAARSFVERERSWRACVSRYADVYARLSEHVAVSA